MAGRQFGPPPSIIKDFEDTWKRWLNLVYRKIYKRTFYNSVQITSGLSIGIPADLMTEGVFGFAPVMLAADTVRQNQKFTTIIPYDWVRGTDIQFIVLFANVLPQTGNTAVVTEIKYRMTALGEDLGQPGSSVETVTPLQLDSDLGLLYEANIVIPLADSIEPGHSIHFELARNGLNPSDLCVGDVAYKDIILAYQGFINHE